MNAAVGSVCRQPEPTLRASSVPTFAPRLVLGPLLAHSLLRLRSRILLRLRATDNDRCTNTAALQTDPPTAWQARPSRHRGPSRHRAFVPSWSRERGRRNRLPAAEAPFRAPTAPTFCASSQTSPLTCARRCFGCVSGFSSDSALRTTTAPQTRLPCRRIPPTAMARRPTHRVIASSWLFHRAIASSRLPFVSSRHRGLSIASSRLPFSCLRVFVVRGSWSRHRVLRAIPLYMNVNARGPGR